MAARLVTRSWAGELGMVAALEERLGDMSIYKIYTVLFVLMKENNSTL